MDEIKDYDGKPVLAVDEGKDKATVSNASLEKVTKDNGEDAEPQEQELHRTLTEAQVGMIAIG
jgi:amino acid permease